MHYVIQGFFVRLFIGLVALLIVPMLSAQAWTLRTLHSFCAKQECPDGEYPEGELVEDANGNIYGTTYYGGVGGNGTVFQLTPVTKHKWKYTAIYKFRCKQAWPCNDENPVGKLILDTAGNLYGTTDGAGSGMVFELQPNADRSNWKLQNLHSFKYGDGVQPTLGGLTYRDESRGLAYDGVSPLYGMTISGGAQDRGTIYEIRPAAAKGPSSASGSAREKVLYSFCSKQNCVDGLEPHGGLVMDSRGNLYGTTAGGGSGTGWFGGPGGVLFQFAKASGAWTETVLYNFCSLEDCADGKSPYAAPTVDSSGNLYGMAHEGGSNLNGVVYKLSSAGIYSVLHDFCSEQGCADGYFPLSPLTMDNAGNLFGTTTGSGTGAGTIFVVNPDFNVLHTFTGPDGHTPLSGMILDPSGNLFGTTYYGGNFNDGGTMFELSP